MEFHQLPNIVYLHLSKFLVVYDFANLCQYLKIKKREITELYIIRDLFFGKPDAETRLSAYLQSRIQDNKSYIFLADLVAKWNLRRFHKFVFRMEVLTEEFACSIIKFNKLNDRIVNHIIFNFPNLYKKMANSKYDFARIFIIENIANYPYQLRNIFKYLKERDKARIYNRLIDIFNREWNAQVADYQVIDSIQKFFILLMVI